MKVGSISMWADGCGCRFSLLLNVIFALSNIVDVRTAAASGPDIGVNVAALQWIPEWRKSEIVEEIDRTGVGLVRVQLSVRGVDFIREADRRGIGIVLIVPNAFVKGAPQRKARPDMPNMWPGPGLAHADQNEFKKSILTTLDTLDDAGVKLRALELGNEFNFAGFNRDFDLPGTGTIYGDDDFEHDEKLKRLLPGFKNYMLQLRMLKQWRDDSQHNKQTPVILGGLADLGPPGIRPDLTADAVAVGPMIRYLRAQGLDSVVDGYAVHFYTPPSRTSSELAERLSEVTFSECGRGERKKPCWLTEWGVAWQPRYCETHDRPRIVAFERMLAALKPFEDRGDVVARILFNWDNLPNYRPGAWTFSATTCGRLTDGARKALSLSPARLKKVPAKPAPAPIPESSVPSRE